MVGARSSSIRRPGRPERGSLSLNVHEELDQGEENQRVMEAHFNEVCVCFFQTNIVFILPDARVILFNTLSWLTFHSQLSLFTQSSASLFFVNLQNRIVELNCTESALFY